jgi:hypothetical protein
MRRIVRAYIAFAGRASGSLDESAWEHRSGRAKAGWSVVLVGIGVSATGLLGLGLQRRGGDPHDVWVPFLLASAWYLPMVAMIPFGLRRAMRFLILSAPLFLLVIVFASWLSFKLWG